MTHRLDFKQALSTLQRLKQEAEGGPQVPTLTEINNRHRALLHGGNGKFHGGLLIFLKVTMVMDQVLTERGDLSNAVFLWTRLSSIQFTFYMWIVYG